MKHTRIINNVQFKISCHSTRLWLNCSFSVYQEHLSLYKSYCINNSNDSMTGRRCTKHFVGFTLYPYENQMDILDISRNFRNKLFDIFLESDWKLLSLFGMLNGTDFFVIIWHLVKKTDRKFQTKSLLILLQAKSDRK